MAKYCFVPTCKNTSLLKPAIRFFCVPNQEDKRRIWYTVIGKENAISKSRNVFCCEEHFKFPDDAKNWLKHTLLNEPLVLKPTAMPHEKLRAPPLDEEDVDEQGTEDVPGTSQFSLKPPLRPPKRRKRDTSTLSTSSYWSPSSSSHWSPSTSSTSPSTSLHRPPSTPGTTTSEDETLYMPIDRKPSTLHLLERHSRFYMGLPKDVYCVTKLICKKEPIQHLDVLICLKKIRLGDVNFRLALDFDLSESTVQRKFQNGVHYIAHSLQNLIFFPSGAKIEDLMPRAFIFRYSNVKYIIDAFEVEIEKPSDPLMQSSTWSDYKKCNTIKYLICSTPHGFINFISKGYGGRISDKTLFMQSKFLDAIQEGSGIMANRGFKHLVPELMVKKCTLIRPPSVGGEQLTKQQVKEAKRIAALRIHIERVIKRVRDFKMLDIHSRIKMQLLQHLDNMVIIACGLINLQGSIM